MKKIFAVVGARPQFIKHAPFELAVENQFELKTIHTGQHYDENMSQIFFDQLSLSKPDYMLDIRSHQHGKQTALMMIEIENILIQEKADGMVVYGDTNSTLAGALVASKLQIPVFHIEAGLRGYNKYLPEEINRIMTDHVSDLLFTPTEVADQNLAKEGITKGVYRTGDIMYDMIQIALKTEIEIHNKPDFQYYFCTSHRPYNVDEQTRLVEILNHLNALKHKVLLPLHPRTEAAINKFGIELSRFPNIQFIEPQSYFQNIHLMKNAEAVITDSGGIQKEAYFLKRKCITLRSETEWVETLNNNWNHLVFEDLETIQDKLDIPCGDFDDSFYGNGKSAEKMVKYITDFFDD
jgi:UDP-GlcNAc3NAcA epimerase